MQEHANRNAQIVVQRSAAKHRIFDARITIISARLEFENGAGTKAKLDRPTFHAKKDVSIPDVVAPEERGRNYILRNRGKRMVGI